MTGVSNGFLVLLSSWSPALMDSLPFDAVQLVLYHAYHTNVKPYEILAQRSKYNEVVRQLEASFYNAREEYQHKTWRLARVHLDFLVDNPPTDTHGLLHFALLYKTRPWSKEIFLYIYHNQVFILQQQQALQLLLDFDIGELAFYMHQYSVEYMSMPICKKHSKTIWLYGDRSRYTDLRSHQPAGPGMRWYRYLIKSTLTYYDADRGSREEHDSWVQSLDFGCKHTVLYLRRDCLCRMRDKLIMFDRLLHN